MTQKLETIHRAILADRIEKATANIKAASPAIEFKKWVNTLSFKDRLKIVYKILWKKL